MRGFVAVFTREIFERRLLGAVALALGGVATVLPLIPGLLPGGLSVSELQGALASGCALLLTAMLALSLGASVIASDLVERRLGFYFARPLAGWAVWAGKLGAALALLLGAGLLVVAPALLAGGSLNLSGVWSLGDYSATGSGLLLAWIVALVLLLLASHAVSVIVRARSVWALLDIVALALVAALVWGALRRMQMEGVVRRLTFWSGREGQLGILAWMEIGFFAALLLALAGAGAVQVVQGRTDVRRSHRILSQTLWGSLLVAAVLFMGVAVWTLAAGPDDLLGISQVSVSPGGRWIAFSGPAARRPGYDPSFLYDVDTGRSIRARFGLIALYGYAPPVHFSEDGRWAAWLQWDVPPNYPVVLYRLDLNRPGANPERTSISFPELPPRWALSPDGRRIAFFLGDHRLTVEEIGGPLLAALRFDGSDAFPLLAFAGPDRLRILDGQVAYEALRHLSQSEEPSAIPDLFELDLTSRPPRIVPTGVMPRARLIREVSLSPDASHALQLSRQTLQLFDARSGELLAVLGDSRVRGVFLTDGRIALATRVAGGQELRLLSPDGRSELWRLPFPGARTLIVADQRGAPGTLRVVTSGPKPTDPTREVWTVDLGHGTARSLGRRRLAYPESPLFTLHLPSHPVTLTDKDGVIWLDPAILRERVVLKGS